MKLFGIEVSLDFSPPPTEEEIDAKLERYNELYAKDTAFVERLEQGHASKEEWAVWEKDHEEQVGIFYDLNAVGVDWHSDDEVEEEPEEDRPWWKFW